MSYLILKRFHQWHVAWCSSERVYNNGGTHTKLFPLPHSIHFRQLAPPISPHLNYPTGTPNTLEDDLPWLKVSEWLTYREILWSFQKTNPRPNLPAFLCLNPLKVVNFLYDWFIKFLSLLLGFLGNSLWKLAAHVLVWLVSPISA